MIATEADVKAITGSELDDSVITPFLTVADHLLNNISEQIQGLADEHRGSLETYLAAHLLVSSTVGQDSALVTKESINGKYSVEYLTPKASGEGILSSNFGLIANSLSGGYLAETDKRPINLLSIGGI